MKELRNKLDYVDALRGVAVLLVLFHHTFFIARMDIFPKFIQTIFLDMSRGVQIFYIMSAFTLFYSLSQRKTEDKNGIIDYSIRRIFRIAPLWYFSILLFAFILPLIRILVLNESSNAFNDFKLEDLLSHLLFLHGFFPEYINSIVIGGWSVGIEIVFYLFVPICYKYIHNSKKALWGFIITTLFAIILTLILKKFFNLNEKEYIFYYLPAQMPFFMLGFLLYHIIILKDYYFGKLGVIITLLLIIVNYIFRERYLCSAWLEMIVIIGFIYLFIKYDSKIINNNFTRYMGKISYSLYLLHFVGIKFMQILNPLNGVKNEILKYFMSFGLMFIISVIISIVTYYLIEKPGVIYGNKLIEKLERKKSEV